MPDSSVPNRTGEQGSLQTRLRLKDTCVTHGREGGGGRGGGRGAGNSPGAREGGEMELAQVPRLTSHNLGQNGLLGLTFLCVWERQLLPKYPQGPRGLILPHTWRLGGQRRLQTPPTRPAIAPEGGGPTLTMAHPPGLAPPLSPCSSMTTRAENKPEQKGPGA